MALMPRRALVTAGAAFAAAGLLFGTGLLGVPVENGFGGALAANATLLSPAGPAFSIWSVIYGGLLGFVVLMWIDGFADRPRVRNVAIPGALSMMLNGLWLLVVQFGGADRFGIWLSVAVIIALEGCLAVIMRRLSLAPAGDWKETVLVDGTFGLYFGWTTVATVANVAAAGHATGWHPSPMSAELISAAVLLVAGLLGVMFARTLGGRFAVAVAMSWGLAWIAVGRLSAEPASVVTGVAAVGASLLVLGASVVARIRSRILTQA